MHYSQFLNYNTHRYSSDVKSSEDHLRELLNQVIVERYLR